MKDNFQRHFTNCSDLLGTCWNMLEPTSLPRACGRAFRAKVESTCFKTSAILKIEGAPWSNMEQHGATWSNEAWHGNKTNKTEMAAQRLPAQELQHMVFAITDCILGTSVI